MKEGCRIEDTEGREVALREFLNIPAPCIPHSLHPPTVIKLDQTLTPTDLLPKLERFWSRSAECIDADRGELPARFGVAGLHRERPLHLARAGPSGRRVFSTDPRCFSSMPRTTRRFLELGRERTLAVMAPHLTHVGVHDHGFNNVSTYGNLWRLMREGRCRTTLGNDDILSWRLKSAAQCRPRGGRKRAMAPATSIRSTARSRCLSIRSAPADRLRWRISSDTCSWASATRRISLLRRLIEHANNTARYNIWFGEGRDAYDVAGRTAHESVFNTNNGDYRCPSTHQGYSPFSTWTRGLAWAMLGFAELLEWLSQLAMTDELATFGGREAT